MNNPMKIAIEQALKTKSDVPVGAVIVKDGKILCKTCNTKENNNDITAHAEILAIKEAAKILNTWRLNDCEMYVTLEPCPMCGWAIIQSRIKKLYYGLNDLNYGAFSKFNMDKHDICTTSIYSGIMEEECDKILKDFFDKIRKEKDN